MDANVEIVFHNITSSAKIETEIRDRVGKLDRLYSHLVACRVSVELLHRRHKTGNLYEVHVDMHVPGEVLVVSHEPHRAHERFADPDVMIALRNAFKAAERRLLDYKHKQRGDVKLHEASGSRLVPGETEEV